MNLNTRYEIGMDLMDLICAECGKPVLKCGTSYTILKEDVCLCEGCVDAHAFIGEEMEGTTYLINDGMGYPLLNAYARKQILAEAGKPILCDHVHMEHGQIPVRGLAAESIIVQEIREDFTETGGLSREIITAMATAKRSEKRCVAVKSRFMNRTVYCIKTSSPEDTESGLDQLGKYLSLMREQDTVHVYMQRFRYDTENLGLRVLAQSGYTCHYYDGVSDEQTREQRFPIDFTAKDLYEYCCKRIIGQEEELKTLCYLVMQQILKACYGLDVPSPSCLLTAPSGSGKSEFCLTVQKFFKAHKIPIPVIRCDLSQITETGFKGKEISSLIKQIEDASNEKFGHAAIVFLDEADKRMVPSYGSNGTNYNAAMQANMLSMVEGSEMDNGDGEFFDTSNTMFILMGAFQAIRDEKRDFGEMLDDINPDPDNATKKSDDQFYGDVTLQEIVQYGMIEELAGRLRMVINFHRLPEDAMRSVICQKCELLGEQMHCQVMLTDKAMEEFLKISYTNLGIREPMNHLAELMTRKLSACAITGDFDADKEMLVVESLNRITIRPLSEPDAPAMTD